MEERPSLCLEKRVEKYKPSLLAKMAFRCSLLDVDPRESNSIISSQAPPLRQEYGERRIALGPKLAEKLKAKVHRSTSSWPILLFSPDNSIVFGASDNSDYVPHFGTRRKTEICWGIWSERREAILVMHLADGEHKMMNLKGGQFTVNNQKFSQYTFCIDPPDEFYAIRSFEVYFEKVLRI